ncbi:hypothetical protein BGZ83_002024 [Gryganskiella cystojenkinii]|nr:hypothetical protein BGZ83_002024 [Gryganskiella cystojenkinii]
MVENSRQPVRTITEQEHYQNVLQFQRFEGIIRFLESSLHFVKSSEDGDKSLEGRLRAVVESMNNKELKYQEIEATNLKLKENIEKLQDGKPLRSPKESTAKTTTLKATTPLTSTNPPKELNETELVAYKQVQDKNTALIAEVTSLKEKLDNKEAARQTIVKHFQTQLSAHKTSVDELRLKAENLTKELARSEKGKRTMQQTQNAKITALDEEKKKNKELETKYSDQRQLLFDTTKKLNNLQQSYDGTKHKSLSRDVAAIKKLTEELKTTNETLTETQKESDRIREDRVRLEKERTEDLKRLLELQEEISARELQLSISENKINELQVSLGRSEKEMGEVTRKAKQDSQVLLQRVEAAETLAQERQSESEYLKETLAAMEVKVSEMSQQQLRQSEIARERDPLLDKMQKTIEQINEENRMLQRTEKLLLKQKEESEEENKRQVLSLQQQLETMTATNEQIKVERDTASMEGSKSEDSAVRTISANARGNQHSSTPSTPQPQSKGHETNDDSLIRLQLKALAADNKNQQQSYEALQKKYDELNVAHRKLQQQQSLNGGRSSQYPTLEEEERARQDIQRALATVASMDETIQSLEDESRNLRSAREQMAETHKQLTEDLYRATDAKKLLEEKVERLERELNRRTITLEVKTKELAEIRTKAQEQQARADSLEMEQEALKKEIATLEKIRVERDQQIEGRDNALKQLNAARNTFEKVFQSKIDRLMDEKAVTERMVEADRVKQQVRHEQEMRKTIEECKASLLQAELTQHNMMIGMQSDVDLIKEERDEYKAKVEELEGELRKLIANIEEQNILVQGYMDLVRQQEAEGMIPEEKGSLLALLNQRQEDIAKIEQLETDLQHLKEIVESQHEILSKYDQTMIMLTNRNESYLTQVQDLELSLANERRGRGIGGSSSVGGDTTPTTKMSPAKSSANSTPRAL